MRCSLLVARCVYVCLLFGCCCCSWLWFVVSFVRACSVMFGIVGLVLLFDVCCLLLCVVVCCWSVFVVVCGVLLLVRCWCFVFVVCGSLFLVCSC